MVILFISLSVLGLIILLSNTDGSLLREGKTPATGSDAMRSYGEKPEREREREMGGWSGEGVACVGRPLPRSRIPSAQHLRRERLDLRVQFSLMEGASPNPVQEPDTQPSNPPPPSQSPPQPSTQTLPPHPPQPPVSADTRKRTFEGIGGSNLHFTKYVKMRALVHDLRPRFVEVLGSPNFRNCKAAGEIREEVKTLMDLFKQIIGGRASGDGFPEEQPVLVMENGDCQKARLEQRFPKPAEKQRTEEDKVVVGGSAFGWNFVTVPSSDSVYYGITKEAFRAAQEINNENNSEHEQVPLTEGGVAA